LFVSGKGNFYSILQRLICSPVGRAYLVPEPVAQCQN
jgi:hypothetical protein